MVPEFDIKKVIYVSDEYFVVVVLSVPEIVGGEDILQARMWQVHRQSPRPVQVHDRRLRGHVKSPAFAITDHCSL
jgi:hypothetical protein